MRVSPARGPVPLVGFRSPRSDPMVLEDYLRSAVLSVTEPSVTRAFMVSSEPGQHKRRAQPASRESRLVVSVLGLVEVRQVDITDVELDVVEARWVLAHLPGEEAAAPDRVHATVAAQREPAGWALEVRRDLDDLLDDELLSRLRLASADELAGDPCFPTTCRTLDDHAEVGSGDGLRCEVVDSAGADRESARLLFASELPKRGSHLCDVLLDFALKCLGSCSDHFVRCLRLFLAEQVLQILA